MERLRKVNISNSACFTCPARVYLEGEYFCDPIRLDHKSVVLNIAKFRPDSCPYDVNPADTQISPELLLRKILRK